LALSISNFTGAGLADIKNALSSTESYLKGIGKTVGFIGVGFTAAQLFDNLSGGKYWEASKNGVDLGMAYVATLGVPGFAISVLYFIADKSGLIDFTKDKVVETYEKTRNYYNETIRQISAYNSNPLNWLRF
jgi:hypothetical protein